MSEVLFSGKEITIVEHLGILFAICTTFCWSLGIFPFTEGAKRFGSAALNQYRLFLAWIIITILACLFLSKSPFQLFLEPSAYNFIYLGLSGFIGFTIGDFFTFNSFRLLGPKLSSVYTTIAPCSALFFGYMFLGEEFNLTGIGGILLTVSGVIWLTLSKKDTNASISKGYVHNTSGILAGIAGAVCQGLGLVLSKVGFGEAGAQQIEAIHAVWIRLLFAFSAAMILALLLGKFKENASIVFKNKNGGMKYMLLGTFLGPVCGVTCSLLAITHLKVAEAQTIFALLPILVLPLNCFINKEKITLNSVFAVLLAVSGVFVLIWREEIQKWI